MLAAVALSSKGSAHDLSAPLQACKIAPVIWNLITEVGTPILTVDFYYTIPTPTFLLPHKSIGSIQACQRCCFEAIR